MCDLPPVDPEDLSALEEIDTADELLGYLDRLDVPPLARMAEPDCHHRSVRLVPTTRTVFCRDCERKIDPFTALMVFTAQWDRYERQLKQMKTNLNDLKVKCYLKQGELFDLRQQEKQIEARLDQEGEGSARL